MVYGSSVCMGVLSWKGATWMPESRSETSASRSALAEGRILGSWCKESPVEAMTSAIRKKRSILCCAVAGHVLT